MVIKFQIFSKIEANAASRPNFSASASSLASCNAGLFLNTTKPVRPLFTGIVSI